MYFVVETLLSNCRLAADALMKAVITAVSWIRSYWLDFAFVMTV